MIWGRLFSIGVGILLLSIVSVAFPATASAATDWLNDELVATEGEIPTATDLDCKAEVVPIGGPLGLREEICVYQADGWRYGIYDNWNTGQPRKVSLAVSFGDEQAMYVVNGLSVEYGVMYIGRSNHIVLHMNYINEEAGKLIVKNFPSKIQKVGNEYQLKPNSIEPLLPNENGNTTPIKTAGISASSNGKWLVVMPEPAGLVRINTQNFEKRWFSKYQIDYSHPRVDRGMPVWLVSNDGQHIGRSSQSIKPTISKVTNECGKEFTIFQSAWLTNPGVVNINPCPERDVSTEISEVIDGDLTYGYLIEISNDANAIEGLAAHIEQNEYGEDVGGNFKWFNLHNTDNSLQRLDYLALGDSYSSGEGDTEKNQQGNKYYRANTDVGGDKSQDIPREKCHISTRSYPYKLALNMGLAMNNPKQWDTVACSGAETIDVIPEDRESDRGQANRLAGFDHVSLKAQALNEMIPGRVKQINFVKRYKPKVITLTMGGNDIGFAEKLADCATNIGTCSLVNERRQDLASEILGQYDSLKTLYEDLYSASGSTAKIFVIGYPQFISGDFIAACKSNTAALNPAERELIANSVIYLNNVIEKAALSAGVKYVDIEDSLMGHRLCDIGEKFVTGLTNLLGLNGNEFQESFHPNTKGHQAIANDIGINLLTYDICPDDEVNICPDSNATKNTVETPRYFENVNNHKNVKHKSMTIFEQVKNTVMDFYLGVLSLQVNSIVSVFIHSEPIHLGDYTVAEDGSLSGSVTIPATLPAGYHTLIVKGITYSGEPVEYEQTILVKGSDPNDIDEDSVNDTVDPCLFITPANIDEDKDGQDDACDLEIGEAPQEPYRIRAGNPQKTYAGQPENANNLYIERNTQAAGITGVSGDYDADNDGWVVIATSQTTTNASPYARSWVEGADGSKVPRLAYRTPEHGCVQYKPANLSVVTEQNNSTLRPLVKEAEDTNTCRSEPPDADADNNGKPDNTQPLYRARNGSPAVTHTLPNGSTFTEDSKHLYLFRSTRGTEAQLNKSDYAPLNPALSPPSTIPPTDTTDYRQEWSLIATTNPAMSNPFSPANYIFPYSYFTVNGTYKQVTMVNGQPFVLTSLFSSPFYTQCTAYKPASLATIKQTTQFAQRLTQDWQQTMAAQMGGCK